MEGGKPTVIANAEGFRTTPSLPLPRMAIAWLVKLQAPVMNPKHLLFSQTLHRTQI